MQNYETLTVIPGFKKKPLQSWAFIARHADPKGLFQVLRGEGKRYFMSLTSQPFRFYEEIKEEFLIELPSFEYMVL
jgi:hypothetical protein